VTIVVSVKINDGIVLSSDSATTLSNDKGEVVNVYNNANKIFNLYKGLPVAAATWGSGQIGHASISTLAKDLRANFVHGGDGWKIDPKKYEMSEIAARLKLFFFDKKHKEVYREKAVTPFLGLRIAGYSADAELPEIYDLSIHNGQCSGPTLVSGQNDIGIHWNGECEAVQRLIIGFGTTAVDALKAAGLDDESIPRFVQAVRPHLQKALCFAPMPVQDAVELAEFLVRTQVEFSRFQAGAQVVGGPIEIATITKHEGFKWVARKHFFAKDLNPETARF
jgi:hypothetical protein